MLCAGLDASLAIADATLAAFRGSIAVMDSGEGSIGVHLKVGERGDPGVVAGERDER